MFVKLAKIVGISWAAHALLFLSANAMWGNVGILFIALAPALVGPVMMAVVLHKWLDRSTDKVLRIFQPQAPKPKRRLPARIDGW